MSYLEEGQEYSVDGDVIDRRSEKISSLSRKVRNLETKLLTYQIKEATEEDLRDENPAVRDAWEKYQTVLRLHKDA